MTIRKSPIHSQSDLRIASMASKSVFGMLLTLFGPILDKLLGVNKLRHLYQKHEMSGLDKQTFAQKLLSVLGVHIVGENELLNKLPKTGRCIVVCNHPYGMVEGVILARLLTDFRSDTKIMANIGLQVFREIKDYFIFANPLKPKASINTNALKKSFEHVKKGGLLVIFPAGKVSYYQSNKQYITDGEWNRIAIKISLKTQTPILPVFISGTNSALFHRLGRIYYRFRLLMLVREMFKLQQHEIKLKTMSLISSKQINHYMTTEKMNDFIRMKCYLNDESYSTPWLINNENTLFKDIISPSDPETMLIELSQLPSEQHLVNFKTFSVYCGYQHQIPLCVREITRLREITFRTLDEGSGEGCDTDKFDETYMHLFIFDHQNKEIIGAYRIGQTDLLLKNGDISQLYLAQMFDFQPEFVNQQSPCLEMGRSFIVEKHQNSFYGLLLLWKGIGAFVCNNPRYRTLYGTVSLSKQYDPRSVSLINDIVVTKSTSVYAKKPFNSQLHPEVERFIASNNITMTELSSWVVDIEQDNKGVPVLLKQYSKLSANFHCIGMDTQFNDTPGLLLSVDLPKAPDKLLKLYLGDKKAQYLCYKY